MISKPGDRGWKTWVVQKICLIYGFSPGVLDGRHGLKTTSAVKLLQEKINSRPYGSFSYEDLFMMMRGDPWERALAEDFIKLLILEGGG